MAHETQLRHYFMALLAAGCGLAPPASAQPAPAAAKPLASSGTPERTFDLESVVIEDIKVEGLVQAWKLRKVCLDGQAYLLVLGLGGPTSITASFRDGKPEQCKAKAP